MENKTILMSINDIKENENNPRTITQGKFRKLVNSIKSFPKMIQYRPLIVNKEGIVLGGNMRLKALKECGFTEIPVIVADDFTEQEELEFIVKDNLPYGEWDLDALANMYDIDVLREWGFSAADLAFTGIIEEEDESQWDADPIYPLAPRISEKHDYVMIVCDNAINYNNLLMKLDMEYNKDYKCDRVGMGRVITYEDFIKRIDEGNSKSGDNEPQETDKSRHKKSSK